MLGAEQVVAAADTAVDPFFVVIPGRTDKCALGPLFTGNVVLFRGKLFLPLRIALGNFIEIYCEATFEITGKNLTSIRIILSESKCYFFIDRGR